MAPGCRKGFSCKGDRDNDAHQESKRIHSLLGVYPAAANPPGLQAAAESPAMDQGGLSGIKSKAKEAGVEIMDCDETGFSSQDNRGRGYSPKGVTPVRNVTGKRFITSRKANM